MKRLTILALTTALTAGTAFAESHVAADDTAMDNTAMDNTAMENNDTMMNDEWDYAQLIRSRDITGGEIYTMNEAMDEGSWGEYEADGIGDDWNEIGEIEDIVLDRNGQMVGVVAEVGGFLDIGDKHVLIRMEDVRLTAVDDETYALVTRKSEEELESMEGVDEGWWD